MIGIKKTRESFLDVRRLVQDLGGRSRLPGALREHRLADVNEQQIDKWLNRNSIRAHHLGALLILARIERRPIDIYSYVQDVREK